MITLIQNRAELQARAREWNTLPGANQNPLLAHEWMMSAAETFHADDELHIFALWKEDRLCAAAPLAFTTSRGMKRLELIGASRLYEPAGILYADPQALQELCNALTTLKHPVMLRRIANPEEFPELLAHAAKGRGYTMRGPTSVSPYLAIQTSWSQYYTSLSSRRRYDFRRARKQLETRGKVSVDIQKPSMAALTTLMAEAMGVESSGWKGRRGSGLMTNSKLRSFFSAYAARACQLGILRLCFLRVGGQPISTQIAIQYAKRWWVLKIGFDEQWADYSPGMQLTMETVRHAIESGMEAFEFLGTSEPWLRIWTQQEHHYTSLDYYPRTLRGTCALAIDGLACATRRLLHSETK